MGRVVSVTVATVIAIAGVVVALSIIAWLLLSIFWRGATYLPLVMFRVADDK